MLDTNCDPDVVDIPIPANDDAIRSIKLIVGKLADAIYEGRHGQLDTSDDYEEFDEALDISAEVNEADETVIEATESEAVASPEPETVAETPEVTAEA